MYNKKIPIDISCGFRIAIEVMGGKWKPYIIYELLDGPKRPSELPKEFGILRQGGHLVSLRGMPDGEFARRMGMSFLKRCLFSLAGAKMGRMAARRGQHYHFIFVHEDGKGLQEASGLLAARRVKASVDVVFPLVEVNQALWKVAAGGSNGKTVLRIG